MGSNSHLLLFTLLICVSIFSDALAALGAERPVGGWTPIKNLSDPKVMDVGKFAVARHNFQAKTRLVFKEVVKGDIQVAAGTEYNLTIAATYGGDDGAAGGIGDILGYYVAVVFDRPYQNFMELVSFRGPI